MNRAEPPIKLEISHTLTQEQLRVISEQVYNVTLEAISKARYDANIDSDLLFSKAALCRYLDNMSPSYLEELLAKGLPQGRALSDRKICFSKSAVKKWLLENDEKTTMPMDE